MPAVEAFQMCGGGRTVTLAVPVHVTGVMVASASVPGLVAGVGGLCACSCAPPTYPCVQVRHNRGLLPLLSAMVQAMI